MSAIWKADYVKCAIIHGMSLNSILPINNNYLLSMKNNLKNIENTYDTVAQEYAEAFFDEHDKKPKDREMLLLFSQQIGNRKPVWDLGCGPGQTTKYLSDLGIDISGMDISGKILKQARSLYPGIYFQKGNILELDFNNNSLAGVVAFYSIVHFSKEQVNIAFNEIFRVLQPDGLFLFTYHIGEKIINVDEFLNKKVKIEFIFFDSNFILKSLNNAGFKNIEITERDPYPEVEYQSRRAYVFAVKPLTNYKN
jgi:ubiquinone/menaquinone biosynthesis C-methylase UbiE